MENRKPIYNIGYQGRTQQEFIELLKAKGITLLVDLREKPFSRIPGFNQEQLSQALYAAGIGYKPMGDLLGGFTCKRGAWQEGCEQLAELSRRNAIVMMCMESDYRNCHRKEVAEMLAFFHKIDNINL
ncbi:MAG: DUF488 domain-containing protein [Planctomycetota bacterium]|jgi:uncharacterized protein (DUF488 family)